MAELIFYSPFLTNLEKVCNFHVFVEQLNDKIGFVDPHVNSVHDDMLHQSLVHILKSFHFQNVDLSG